jgi:lipase chaperone LimK
MTKKKIFVICIIGVLSALLVYRLIYVIGDKIGVQYVEKHYIFDKSFHVDQEKHDFPAAEYIPYGKITPETLKFFRFLEQRLAVQSIAQLKEHFIKVKKYLDSRFRQSESRRLFELYKKHLECQIELVNDRKYQVGNQDPRNILILLGKAQNLRRARLGRATADALYGSEVKEREYILRKAIIIGDGSLYGKEKETRLLALKRDMWNERDAPIDTDENPYNRYQLKIQLYEKDLSEMDGNAYDHMIQRFRGEFFSREQVRRLKEIDEQIAREKKKMDQYRTAERKILKSTGVTQKEKEERIESLQEDFFGKDAEAFRRREAMRVRADGELNKTVH